MTIAFFDFDGTITRKDTLWEIIRFHRGRAAMYAGIVQLLPALIQFKCKLTTAQEMKQQVLQYFFSEMTIADFNAKCEAFCQQELPSMIRPKALTAIRKHQQLGHKVVVVTASAHNWVAPWCKTTNVACIGTELEVKNKRITGNILGLNCNGEEKVNRIRRAYRLEDFQQIYAYGDSKGDRPMLELAQHAEFKPFRD
ncbi:HAD superfamily hydrolase (TIGR01490 family) [Chitinophaga niastensis]|uniref:HAD superfamily hydrolase (TIGR01490 family) n=1 Tax=Chitinophaga niastensis TaxID=536980 RepID=A0A2P8HB36_CHINA|nr:HAD family hydrolase [Chitinophaga niastensis]PSL43430.1 HAD superfamily hydrolase (TIGR01490 family) [Chitinophaga niastensis]